MPLFEDHIEIRSRHSALTISKSQRSCLKLLLDTVSRRSSLAMLSSLREKGLGGLLCLFGI